MLLPTLAPGGRTRQKMPSRRGFTLVEMMVIIGLMGLIAAIAVPSFNGYLRANEVDTIADRITSDMALARSLSGARTNASWAAAIASSRRPWSR